MTETLSKHERNLSAAIHVSTLSRFFIPFGNFLFPLVIWLANRQQHPFVDYNGRQALNFQISFFLYSAVLGVFSVPFFIGLLPDIFNGGLLDIDHFHGFRGMDMHWGNFFRHGFLFWPLGIAGLIHVGLYVTNIVYTILATIRTNEGQYFRYPLTIKFIR
jgi:uncharacterized Tic20 family protein